MLTAPEQFVSLPEQLVCATGQLQKSAPEQFVSLPEQLASAPEQLRKSSGAVSATELQKCSVAVSKSSGRLISLP